MGQVTSSSVRLFFLLFLLNNASSFCEVVDKAALRARYQLDPGA